MGIKFKKLTVIALASLLLLAGCASNPQFRKRCRVTIDVEVASQSMSTHPDIRRGNSGGTYTHGVCMPVNGKIWVRGRMDNEEIKIENQCVLGHEVWHILEYHCNGFADPDKPDTLFGWLGW